MSRSIGDTVGSGIGVISNPYIKRVQLCGGYDHVIILGSDGIWDMMDNPNAVNYVEKFKK